MTADDDRRYDPATWPDSGWKWFRYGYERGVRSGIEIGYADGYTDGEFAEAARKGPIAPDDTDMIGTALRHIAAQQAARRAAALPVALTPPEIRDQAATSWAQAERLIAGAA